MDCDDVGETMEIEDNRNEIQEVESKSVEEDKESKELDENLPAPALVINTRSESGWRY